MKPAIFKCDNRAKTALKALFALCVTLLIGTLTLRVFGCGWFGTDQSVRFNGYQTEAEMGRLPPLPTLANELNDARSEWAAESVDSESEYEFEQQQAGESDALWASAENAEGRGDLPLARQLLEQYLERTKIRRTLWFAPRDRQARRNSALDKIDALKALDQGASVAAVQAYLAARRAYEKGEPLEAFSKLLNSMPHEPNLSDNIVYLGAARLYRVQKYPEAAAAFAELNRKFPRSEKRDAALLMLALSTMKTSSSFTPTSGDPAHLRIYLQEGRQESESRKQQPQPELHRPDVAWQRSFATFKQLIREYPRGRFHNDARGWLAYLLLRADDRAGALVEYYRQLSDRHDEAARIEAAFSLTYVRHHATEEEMRRVEQELEDEPETALTYAYHNIYNYAIDPGCPLTNYYAYYEVRDEKGQYDYEASAAQADAMQREIDSDNRNTSRRELLRVLHFAKRGLEGYPKLKVGAAFALRSAQAALELGENELAASFARRAINAGATGKDREQALFVAGVAQHRLGKYEAAERMLKQLIRENPLGELSKQGRMILAMVAEDSGDIEGALEQYLALDYKLDVAYFVDTLMTIEQLEAFIERHRESPKHNDLVYALGVRYLRAKKWEQARKTLARVKTVQTSDYDSNYARCGSYGWEFNYGCKDPKYVESWSHNQVVITPSLVLRDMQTANDLEEHERLVEAGQSNEAKAEALYQLASYQYEASTLLFYNPIAWTGNRYWNLSEFARRRAYRRQGEAQLLWQYMQEHETLARALVNYLEVVNRFPETRAARDALYSAAVCHERLSNYSDYWRETYAAGLHAGSRMVSYDDVRAAYPNYQLPRGTYRWKPSTRTVNGGPGWASPPKPKPRITRLGQVKLLALAWFQYLESLWDRRIRYWCELALLVAAVIFALRRSAQARYLLRDRLVRQRSLMGAKQPEYPWMALFMIDPPELSRRDRLRMVTARFRRQLTQLICDEQGRSILAQNLVTHSILLMLLVLSLRIL